HAAYYLQAGSAWAERVTTHEGVDAMRRLRIDAENLAAVHSRALAERAMRDACLAVLALEPVFAARGPYSTYVSMLDATIAAAETIPCAPELRARALLARGQARQVQ